MNIFCNYFLLFLKFLLFLLCNKMSVIFSDFLLLNEMSMCMEKLSTSLFTVHALFMLCYLFKVSRIDVDDPVCLIYWEKIIKTITVMSSTPGLPLRQNKLSKKCCSSKFQSKTASFLLLCELKEELQKMLVYLQWKKK